MIRFFAYVLLVALTMQSFYRSIMLVDYELHLPDYIAKCINKDKAELHCNGKCELMKKIKTKEKEETKKSLVVYEANLNYLVKEPILWDQKMPVANVLKLNHSIFTIDYIFTFLDNIDRPPIV